MSKRPFAAGLLGTGRRCASGFALLELVIAFAIAALALGLLYKGGIEGLLASRQAARTHEAIARARSRLATLCVGAQLKPGEQSGDDGSGFRWRTQVGLAGTQRLEPDATAAPVPAVQASLMVVRVVVSWGGNGGGHGGDRSQDHQVALESRCVTVDRQ